MRVAVRLMLLMGTLALSMNAAAQNQKITPPLSGIEERVRSSLLAMSDYLKTSKSYSFRADVQYDDVLPSGQKIQFVASSDISIRRPNGLFAYQISDNGSRRLWFDGKQLTLFDPSNMTYAVDAFAGNTDKALEHMIAVLRFTPPLADFLFEDPFKALTRTSAHGFWVGTSPVEGVTCQHFAFVDRYIDWQIWIEEGKQPLPRKLVITYKTLPQAPQYIAILKDWDFTTRLPDTLFRANIPNEATKLPFLKEAQAISKTPTP